MCALGRRLWCSPHFLLLLVLLMMKVLLAALLPSCMCGLYMQCKSVCKVYCRMQNGWLPYVLLLLLQLLLASHKGLADWLQASCTCASLLEGPYRPMGGSSLGQIRACELRHLQGRQQQEAGEMEA